MFNRGKHSHLPGRKKNERGEVVIIENALLINSYSNNLAGVHLPKKSSVRTAEQSGVCHEYLSAGLLGPFCGAAIFLFLVCFSVLIPRILKVSVSPFWNNRRIGEETRIWGHDRPSQSNKGVPVIMRPQITLHHNGIFKK